MLKHPLKAKHFSLSEILSQNNRHELFDLLNNPYIIKNMESLLLILDILRDSLDAPIFITSFYRDPVHNKSVGGVKTSRHLIGAAVDITSSDFPSLYKLVTHFNKDNWRVLPYIKRQFLHIELIKYDSIF